MLWSPQQDQALTAVAKWVKSRNRLFGYAGTGETTLARHLAEGVKGQVLFAAFTGKAALVMRNKGCHDASTIHRLIYRTESVFVCPDHPDDMYETDADGCRWCDSPLVHRPRFTINQDSPLTRATLLIVDECSMVNESLGHDLMSFGVPILVLGDPFQLPPPEGCGFFTEAEPDIMLTRRRPQHYPTIYQSTGSVGPFPGDRLVCLRNNHQMGLLNGEQFTLQRVNKISNDGFMTLSVKSDDGNEFDHIETHHKFFTCAKVEDARARVKKRVDEFAYGYALTAHKSQGSQWDTVVVNDERYVFENPQRWLYTAVTRAKERVIIITQHG